MKFLVLVLYYDYVRCNLWGKLGEGYMGLLCTIFANSYESIIISKLKVEKIKIRNKKIIEGS